MATVAKTKSPVTGQKKRRKLNKSRFIREAIAELGEDTPTRDIVAHVGAKNKARVSPTLVSQVRHGNNRQASDSQVVSINDLVKANALAEQLGGPAKARRLLGFVERLRRRSAK